VNNSKPHWVIEKVMEAVKVHLAGHCDQSMDQVTVACYGLAFKPDIDDLRESPALEIVEHLVKAHSGPLLCVEPNVDALPRSLGPVRLVALEEARRSADIHVMLVDHREFKASERPDGLIVDTRGVWR
jgi:UDP-N-acetyl-D-mannosaminuronic acid dehydrogenase